MDQLAAEIKQANKHLEKMNEELNGIKVTLALMFILPLLIFVVAMFGTL